MDIILVPAPPKEAFQKLRPISNLIQAQVDHFKHVEEQLSREKRKAVPQHPIVTENDAALYIGAMTRLLRSRQGQAKKPKPVVLRKPAQPQPLEGLKIAASAKSTSKPAKKAPSKPSQKALSKRSPKKNKKK